MKKTLIVILTLTSLIAQAREYDHVEIRNPKVRMGENLVKEKVVKQVQVPVPNVLALRQDAVVDQNTEL